MLGVGKMSVFSFVLFLSKIGKLVFNDMDCFVSCFGSALPNACSTLVNK